MLRDGQCWYFGTSAESKKGNEVELSTSFSWGGGGVEAVIGHIKEGQYHAKNLYIYIARDPGLIPGGGKF